VSQSPVIHRSDSVGDSRPKRDIHPPPPRDIIYKDEPRRMRQKDPQLNQASKELKAMEKGQKTFAIVEPFLYPIQEIISAIPEYRSKIKKPLDLNIIKLRLEDGVYDTIDQLDGDIRLMLNNAKTFNPSNHPVHEKALQFEQLWSTKMTKSILPKIQDDVKLEDDEEEDEDYLSFDSGDDGEFLGVCGFDHS
jgi:bromodomain-containing factor 1